MDFLLFAFISTFLLLFFLFLFSNSYLTNFDLTLVVFHSVRLTLPTPYEIYMDALRLEGYIFIFLERNLLWGRSEHGTIWLGVPSNSVTLFRNIFCYVIPFQKSIIFFQKTCLFTKDNPNRLITKKCYMKWCRCGIN